jgi:hypothetical protein|eukprot:COSAG01_NODE_11002_length_2029_cov_6.309845_1_plen_91_part_00
MLGLLGRTRPSLASPIKQGGPGFVQGQTPAEPADRILQDRLSAKFRGKPVHYKRNVPASVGPSPPVLLGGVFALMAFGWWRYGAAVEDQR